MVRTILKLEELKKELEDAGAPKRLTRQMLSLYEELYREAYDDGQSDLKEDMGIDEE